MAVPKKKKSKARVGNHASHSALERVNIGIDSDGNLHLQHRATKLPDGSYTYKGRVIISSKKKQREEGR